EVVTFQFGIIPKDKKFSDTAKGELKVTLGKEWKQYEILVEGKDLTRIKTGFVWTAAAPGKPFAFHLDDIRWEEGGGGPPAGQGSSLSLSLLAGTGSIPVCPGIARERDLSSLKSAPRRVLAPRMLKGGHALDRQLSYPRS